MIDWYYSRRDLADLIYQDLMLSEKKVMFLKKTELNVTESFLKQDFSQICINKSVLPIFLPCVTITEFLDAFSKQIWMLFKNDKKVIELFLSNQSKLREAELRTEISHIGDSKKIPTLGLYDAYQILSLSKRQIILLSDDIEQVMPIKVNSELWTALQLFFQNVPNARALFATKVESTRVKIFNDVMNITELPAIDTSKQIDYSLTMVKHISPHLDISRSDAHDFYKQCQHPKDYLHRLQSMVLQQEAVF